MDAKYALLGVVVGAVLSAAGSWVTSYLQDRRSRERWIADQAARHDEAQFTAIAQYLGAVGAWRTQLSRLWQGGGDGDDGTVPELDAVAGQLYYRRFDAQIRVDSQELQDAIDGVQHDLEVLFLEAVGHAPLDRWQLRWGRIDDCTCALADQAQAEWNRRRSVSQPES